MAVGSAKVKIRQWDDMVKEFGKEDFGIPCEVFFTNDMRYLCGKIIDVEIKETGQMFYDGWEISCGMIERGVATSYRIDEVLGLLYKNPEQVFEHISDTFRFTISYYPNMKDYIFNVYQNDKEIYDFDIQDIMNTDMKWKIKTNLLPFQDALNKAMKEDKKLKHKDMFCMITWQELFWDYSKEEILRMSSGDFWEVEF